MMTTARVKTTDRLTFITEDAALIPPAPVELGFCSICSAVDDVNGDVDGDESNEIGSDDAIVVVSDGKDVDVEV